MTSSVSYIGDATPEQVLGDLLDDVGDIQVVHVIVERQGSTTYYASKCDVGSALFASAFLTVEVHKMMYE